VVRRKEKVPLRLNCELVGQITNNLGAVSIPITVSIGFPSPFDMGLTEPLLKRVDVTEWEVVLLASKLKLWC
jgi:hypothetical protein